MLPSSTPGSRGRNRRPGEEASSRTLRNRFFENVATFALSERNSPEAMESVTGVPAAGLLTMSMREDRQRSTFAPWRKRRFI